MYPELETATLSFYLESLVRTLGPRDTAVQAALAGRSPADVARAAVDGTTLKDPAARRALVAGGAAAVAASKDPMIALARALDPETRQARKRYEDDVESVHRDAGARIARAQFELGGQDGYPDATFTLRLSHGQIRGYTEKGRKVPWAANFRGMYKHATGKPPFALPTRWLAKKDVLRLDTPMNFVSTNDIIGGNSGSPVINKAGQLVGIIFDGNIQSLGNRFVYSEEQARSVSVASQGIIEGLRAIYDAHELVGELREAAVRHAERPGGTVGSQPSAP